MKYNGVVISDLHWGVMQEDEMWDQYEFIFYFLEEFPVDYIVIAGDYFDFKLYLDSKRTVRALEWFDRLYHFAKKENIKKIRMIRGTISHDADQMNVFRKYEGEDGFFRIYETCTSEEILPGLRCVFCPDEIMNTGEYILTYMNELFADNKIGFFHGSFDVVLQQDIDLIQSIINVTDPVIGSITFPYILFQKLVEYAWIGGHWHNGEKYENVIYTGSATRWKHNEYNSKGFGLISVDMDDHQYFYCKIENPNAPEYLTYEVHPEDGFDESVIRDLIEQIDKKRQSLSKENIKCIIRILVFETKKSSVNDNIVRLLKEHYSNVKEVSVNVKARTKKRKKEEASSENKLDYTFLINEQESFAKRLQEFIKLRTNEEIPLEYIERYIAKFMK